MAPSSNKNNIRRATDFPRRDPSPSGPPPRPWKGYRTHGVWACEYLHNDVKRSTAPLFLTLFLWNQNKSGDDKIALNLLEQILHDLRGPWVFSWFILCTACAEETCYARNSVIQNWIRSYSRRPVVCRRLSFVSDGKSKRFLLMITDNRYVELETACGTQLYS